MPKKPKPNKKSNRPRGAQKGNLNALKHGFYSRQLSPAEIKDLQTIQKPVDLEDEIEMQRVLIRRILAVVDQATTAAEIAALSKAQAIVVNTLNRLVRTQALLETSLSQDEISLLDALNAVHLEYALTAPNPQDNHETRPLNHPPKPRPNPRQNLKRIKARSHPNKK